MIFKSDSYLCSTSHVLLALVCLGGFSLLSLPAVAQEGVETAIEIQDDTVVAMPEDAATQETSAAVALEGSEEAIELESLRGLPYLTIEDTLRYKRELVGEVEPLKPDTSLMFSSWEHALLREMKRQDATARPATAGELLAASRSDQPRVKGIRELSLGGIVFAGVDDWTIWLNGQRVTPDAIPKEILDMRVSDSYVEIKWFDSYTNLVYPLRLRPHQRFNLDNRIFLPGMPAGAL